MYLIRSCPKYLLETDKNISSDQMVLCVERSRDGTGPLCVVNTSSGVLKGLIAFDPTLHKLSTNPLGLIVLFGSSITSSGCVVSYSMCCYRCILPVCSTVVQYPSILSLCLTHHLCQSHNGHALLWWPIIRDLRLSSQRENKCVSSSWGMPRLHRRLGYQSHRLHVRQITRCR
jgi:hypothetical protein